MDETDLGRRQMLAAGGMGLAGAALTASAAQAQAQVRPPLPIDVGQASAGEVVFAQIHAATERPDPPLANPDPPARRVGFAIMGLGRLALQQILPAFAECRHARPVALVSGDADKMRDIAAQYGIAAEACYDYAGFDRIRDNPQIEVVYVVLPNALHRDAVVRAARAGKHVLCEKPMADTVEAAEAMVGACRRANRKLMIAYRIQYEINHRDLVRRARGGELGDVQLIDAINTQNQGDPMQWRQNLRLAGGGALPDVGLYCLNTSRALLGEEPVEVSAAIHSPPDDPRFREVESNVSFTLRFASGVIANCATSYSLHEHRNFRVLGSQAMAEVENAFAYEGQRLRTSRRVDKAEANSQFELGRRNQFSLEIDHMASCVRRNLTPRTPGEEGLQDQRIMASIYLSARTNRPVRLREIAGRDVFRGPEPGQDG